ncbi:unnamed protein product [Rotaria sordida]|uniref:Centrosomal protein of 89 kDa n=2 Tax=Rotaria sordida TaxID=392033 RepID=A0A814R590_9BILA|nr:unnamed protein product [Rotaria sordida]CAF1129040.1 unnamed protein product [Rotaria sordida]
MPAKRGKKGKSQLYSHIASAIIPVTSIVAVPSAVQQFPQQKTRATDEWGPIASTLLRASLTSQILIPLSSSRTSLDQYVEDDSQPTKTRTPVGRMDASTDDEDESDEEKGERKYQESLHASTVRSSISRVPSLSNAEKRVFGHVVHDEESASTIADDDLSSKIHSDRKQTPNAELSRSLSPTTTSTTTTDDKNLKRASVTIVRQHVPPLVLNPSPSQLGPSSAKPIVQKDSIGDEAKSTTTTTTTARSSLNDSTAIPVSIRSVSFKEPVAHETYDPTLSVSQKTNTVITNNNYSVLDKIVIPPPEEYQHNFNDLEKRNRLLIDEVQQLRKVNQNLQTQQEELLNRLQTSQKLSQRELNDLLKQAGRDQTKDLENLNKTLQNRCDQLQNELILMRERYAQDQSQSSTQELKKENHFLKDYIHRLTVASSEYQTMHPPNVLKNDMDKEQRNLKALPMKGPSPIWLLNQKFLAPLFVCYDEKLYEREEFIRKLQTQLNELQDQVKLISNENLSLHERIIRTSSTPSTPINQSPTYIIDIENIKRQAYLVLEENKILQEHLNLQTNKLTDIQKAQIQEVSDLTRRLMIIESEKTEADRLLETMRIKNEELRKNYEKLIMDNDHRIHVDDHVREISEMKRLTDELSKKHASEMQLLLRRVQDAETAKRVAQLTLTECRNNIERLKNDIHSTKKLNRKLLLRVETFGKKLELQQIKEQRTTTMLDKANEEIEKYKLEQETYFTSARTKDEEVNQTKIRMQEETKKIIKLENLLEDFKNESKEHVNEVQEQMKKQYDNLKLRYSEHEERIRQLLTLLNEKEIVIDDLSSERRNLEVDLDAIWRTTNADNIRMRQQLLDMHAMS